MAGIAIGFVLTMDILMGGALAALLYDRVFPQTEMKEAERTAARGKLRKN